MKVILWIGAAVFAVLAGVGLLVFDNFLVAAGCAFAALVLMALGVLVPAGPPSDSVSRDLEWYRPSDEELRNASPKTQAQAQAYGGMLIRHKQKQDNS